jgi:protein SCO1
MGDQGDKAMKDRREILAAGAKAIPAIALGFGDDCERPARGPDAGEIPNHVVITHQGAKALFYDDLLAGRTVVLHCMSIATEPQYRTAESLARVQPLLAGRLGRDVFFYSLTVDPERDTVYALRDFAARQGAGPGWSFLTGEPAALLDLKERLFSHGGHVHGAGGEAEDCAMAMLRYGNAAVGLWGAVPAGSDPEWLVRRLSWVESREPAAGPPRRGGPHPDTYLRSEGRMS